MRFTSDKDFNDGCDENGNALESCFLAMEKVSKNYQNLQSYGQNFEFRDKVIDVGIAVKIMIYP